MVAGCGLLGTSVARAFRRANPQAVMIGIEPHQQSRDDALKQGVFTQVVGSLGEAKSLVVAISGAHVIAVAATPPAHLAETMVELALWCDLVMDVGSIKAPVVEALQALPAAARLTNLVPCHPMAGSHERGPAAAFAELFDRRWVFVVPLPTSSASHVKDAHAFWSSLGASTEEIDAHAHDTAVAYTSHLPHLLASAYMEVETPEPAAAGTGFMEFTRLAKANPEMWGQVLVSNRAAWQPVLRSYIKVLQRIDGMVDSADATQVEAWLEARKEDRLAAEQGAVAGASTGASGRAVEPPVITIDGPSGSGKGTLAKALAKRLGWHLLDSGSLYRIVGWAAESRGLPLDDEPQLAKLALSLVIRFDDDETWVDGVGAEAHIRTEEAGAAASHVAALPEVRAALDKVQKSMRKAPGLVADGRDMGTVVFPEAQLKIFLEASAEVRAERRYKQLKEKGSPANVRALLDAIKDRDERDKGRAVSPLVPAEDAVVLDSTAMTIDAVIEQAFELARDRQLVSVD